jgi:NADPH-dependent curcumin reductase CurA
LLFRDSLGFEKKGAPIMNIVNHQFRLAARPVGMPKRSDWSYTEEKITGLGGSEVLVKVLYLSLEPAMRGWINEGRSYAAPVGIGEVMRAAGVGRVVVSKDPRFQEGDYVAGRFGVQEYSKCKGNELIKVDTNTAPIPVFLNVLNTNGLGLPGMTAYFGMLEIGQPKTGETVVVSGAAGAVGMTAGQIAKIKGCRVVGIAGGAEKCQFIVKELGFDAAINYKAEDVKQALRTHCPKGLNVYFDNVGGDILEACLANRALHARVVICGAISQYCSTTPVRGPSNYMALLVYRARMEGFLVFDYAAQYPQAQRELAAWMKEGKLKSREDIVEDFETFPEALLKLFKGENFGKLILKIADSVY